MPDKLELMRHVTLFRTLDDDQLHTLVAAARECVYPREAAIVEQGQNRDESQDGDSLYVILQGRVDVVREGEGRQQHIAQLGPGQFFGEMSLLDGKPRSATVIALEDTQCLILPRWDLLRTMRKEPEVAIHMLEVLSRRLRSVLDVLV